MPEVARTPMLMLCQEGADQQLPIDNGQATWSLAFGSCSPGGSCKTIEEPNESNKPETDSDLSIRTWKLSGNMCGFALLRRASRSHGRKVTEAKATHPQPVWASPYIP